MATPQMAVKRKHPEGIDGMSPKKSRISAAEDYESDMASDDFGDYRINYTDNGTRRADSEARRQWNYVCPVESCAQRFNRPCRLEAHMRSHTKQRPFACTIAGCDKTFPRKDHLQRHMKNAHSDPDLERTYICDWQGCGKSFTSNGRLQRHKDVHASKFYCTEFPPCNEHFRKAKALEAHVKSQHLEVKPYHCTFVDAETGNRCTSGFQTEGALRRHMNRLHLTGQDESHFCMLCAHSNLEAETIQDELGVPGTTSMQPVSFATSEELAAHTGEHHPPECIECGQKFKNASTLKSHFDTVHADPTEQPQFTCPRLDCGSVFNRKHNLTVHIQTVHEQQFRYFCYPDALQKSKHADLRDWNGQNACGAAFKAKSSLDQHVRTHHLNLGTRKELRKAAKPSKKKSDPSTLTLLTGVGYEQGRNTPCLVPTCDFRFYMDRDLRRHLRAAHHLPDDEINELIIQRNAMTGGGPFWIGGLDDHPQPPYLESAEPSMPQTPTPYLTPAPTTSHPYPTLPPTKENNTTPSQPSYFDPRFDHLVPHHTPTNYEMDVNPSMDMDMQLNLEMNLDLDLAMGLQLQPLGSPVSMQHGVLLCDALAPVERFNHGGG